MKLEINIDERTARQLVSFLHDQAEIIKDYPPGLRSNDSIEFGKNLTKIIDQLELQLNPSLAAFRS